MFHNYGCGGKHTSKRDAPTARNARRLENKKLKKKRIKEWEPVYGWEGDVLCEQLIVDENPNMTYEKAEKALVYFEKYGVNLG